MNSKQSNLVTQMQHYAECRKIPLEKEFALSRGKNSISTHKGLKLLLEEIDKRKGKKVYLKDLRMIANVILIIDNTLFYSSCKDLYPSFYIPLAGIKKVFDLKSISYEDAKSLLTNGFIILDLKSNKKHLVAIASKDYNSILYVPGLLKSSTDIISDEFHQPEELAGIIDLDHFDTTLLKPELFKILFNDTEKKENKVEEETVDPYEEESLLPVKEKEKETEEMEFEGTENDDSEDFYSGRFDDDHFRYEEEYADWYDY